MKKLWLVVALIAGGGLAINTFADVQNIRLSGDIRIRAYYLNGTDSDVVLGVPVGPNKGDAAFISQRTRVSVEADLEDHVLVVVTLKAEGLWGQSNDISDSTGAGTANPGGSDDKINRNWDVGVTEAYVQFNEMFYSAATLKLGRQYLHYGRGLIISSVEQEYNYDAARLVLDYYPLTIDIVGAQLVNNQAFGGASSHAGAADLLFINARYEMSDSPIKAVEAYFGWVATSRSPFAAIPTTVPPLNGVGASPMLLGARADVSPAEGIQMWVEAAYEFGDDGVLGGNDLSAFIANVGGRFTMKDTQWSPAFNANYIYASGGGQGNVSGTFVPWFDYADGYNGYLFAPALANIHILNVGASVKPYENTTLSLQAYYYMKADSDGVAGSNVNVDFGGPTWSGTTAASRELGWEFDSIVGYDYSKDVRFQLVYGVFLPENAYQNAGFSVAVHEVRGEVNVRF